MKETKSVIFESTESKELQKKIDKFLEKEEFISIEYSITTYTSLDGPMTKYSCLIIYRPQKELTEDDFAVI